MGEHCAAFSGKGSLAKLVAKHKFIDNPSPGVPIRKVTELVSRKGNNHSFIIFIIPCFSPYRFYNDL